MKKLKNYIVDRENIDISEFSILGEYAKVISDNINSSEFSKQENVVITLDSNQIDTTEYTVKISKEQTTNILKSISDKIETDEQLLNSLTVKDVQNFEEQDTILEFNDNDTVSEVVGDKNNFNTSLTIWGENTISLNQVDASNTTNINSNTIMNNTVSNEDENTQSNENVTIENTTLENQENEQHQEQLTDEPEETISEEETIPQPTQENQAEENNTIQEDDNYRLQGYISVNEEDENNNEPSEFVIGENYTETIKNIVDLSENIDWKSYLLTGAKANTTHSEIVTQIQKIIDSKIKENISLIMKIYVSEGKTIKMNIEIPETEESFDFEIISKGNKEKYLNVKVLKGNKASSSGNSISLYKKVSDAVLKYRININKIQKNKISQKTNINSQIEGTSNSKQYTITSGFSYINSDGEFKTDIQSVIDFDNLPEIQELNNENCLFIDELSDDEFYLNTDAIKQKIYQVLNEKNRNLNIIDISNGSSVVQQSEQQQTTQVNEQAKSEAKQALIQVISNKMGEYQNNGQTLKIEDLAELQIPGYNVDISISSNLAIITVNEYKFKLDSDFNLSDS